jgi:Protein of unknown function (DUF1071)
MEKSKTVFERLSAINVNEHVEKKDNLSYLSWAWAWSEVKKACPDATYKIGETEYDDALGFMCHTSVTINGETLEMWLPVMDGKNKSMKKHAYEYDTKWGKKTVEAATTFDINKTMMRCLVKNLAMFGLGIYIYAGEDLPEVEASAPKVAPTKTTTKSAPKKLEELNDKHKNWEIVKKALADGKTSMERLKGLYIVSKEVESQLTA